MVTWTSAACVLVVASLTLVSLVQDAPRTPPRPPTTPRSFDAVVSAAGYLFGAVAFQVGLRGS